MIASIQGHDINEHDDDSFQSFSRRVALVNIKNPITEHDPNISFSDIIESLI